MDFSEYLIVTDLDGTFLARGGRGIPQKNLEAVATFTKGGGLFTTATGRLHTTLLGPVPQAATLFNAPVILSNGAYLYDYATKTHLCKALCTPVQAAQMLAFVKAHAGDVPCRVATPYTVRTATPYGLVARDLSHYPADAVEVMPYEAWPLDDWCKIVFRAVREVLEALRVRAKAFFDADIAVFFSGKCMLEMQPAAVTKASGIEKLRTLTGGGARTVIACGDFENDMDMLRAADIAVAPANAIEDIKAMADYVLCDCDEGLIADVVAGLMTGRIVKRA